MQILRHLAAFLLLASAAVSATPVGSKDVAVQLTLDAIHKYHLTTIEDECGLVDVVDKPSYFEIVVRERHTQSCGGNAETGPRLFSVRVRKRDGRLTSDAYDGVSYQPVDRDPDQTRHAR